MNCVGARVPRVPGTDTHTEQGTDSMRLGLGFALYPLFHRAVRPAGTKIEREKVSFPRIGHRLGFVFLWRNLLLLCPDANGIGSFV